MLEQMGIQRERLPLPSLLPCHRLLDHGVTLRNSRNPEGENWRGGGKRRIVSTSVTHLHFPFPC